MITLKRLAVASYKGIRALDLAFPERGSILIEGRNEAGKSTLFDAVHYALYGVPMVGDLGAALHYGAEQMEVRLELAVSGTQLHAWRRTRQTAKSLRSEAGLSVIPPGGEDPEEVKGTSPVTQRLQLELGGLTAEALLNSCLVAQKQLGRLETLTRASREEALTILLNLGKLSDVQGRLRPRAQDEDALRAARARVSLARTQEALGALAQERETLQRRRGLVRLRDGLAHLEQLDASSAAARQTLAQHQQGLVRVREARSRLESCKTARARWQRAQEVALQGTAALRELETATRQVEAAGEAGAALPGARAALDRARQARDDAEALVAHQGRLRELAQEGQRLEARLEERARTAKRAQRLEQELVRLRGERQQAVDALNALAPLATEQEQLTQRLAALQALQARGGQLQSVRQTVEDLQEQGVTRAEADARHEAARRALDAASAALAGAEERRRWREVALALRRWRAARIAADQAARERRLLDDLALSVAGVEHVALPLLPGAGPAAGPAAPTGAHESGGTGLRLSLLIDHPLTGVQVVRLRLWAGGAELLEARPATAAESSGLEAGHLPRLDASTGDNSEAELEAAGAALLALREPLPDGEADAARRLGAVEQALTGGARGASEVESSGAQEAYLQTRAAAIAAGDRLREADADRQGLPDGATLGRQLEVARRELEGVERACLDAGRLLDLDGPDADAVLCAVPPALAAGQQRSHQLAEATGQRNALHARRLDVERLGLDYKHQLQECRDNLQRDEEEALVARRVSLDAERETVAAEGARLYAGVVAGAREWGEGAGAGQGALLSQLYHGGGQRDPQSGPLRGTDLGVGAEVAPSGAAGDGREAGNGLAVADALPDVAGLRRDLGQRYDRLQGEVAVLERQAQAGAEAEAGLQGAKGRLAEVKDELSAALAAAGAAPEWATAELAATAAEAGRRAAAAEVELASLDEPAVQSREHFLQKEIWGTEEVQRTLARGAERQVGELLDLAHQLGHEAPDTVAGEAETAPAESGDGVAETAVTEPGDGDGSQDGEGETARANGAAVATWLREACPEVTGDLPSLDTVEEALDALGQREWEGQRSAQEARLLLGDEAPLSVAEAEAALATATLDLAARRRAQDILGQTRQRMINKVLPDTMRNMCLLLPLLTAGRYRYAELTPDYRLQVWDERKHGYVEKTLYSGGTQDQFSLALRLGFALAALPRELGTSPGFLFLDEPLSSFDHDRTAALIDLLTKGQIATFFQQVFLISHSQAFDPASFTHHIVMEDGAVAAGTLEGQSGP